jgi:mannose-6-phosphate isomerase-like protein (cupin superfamily)
MKRHPSLEPFSRDHNVGLILARRLIAGEDGSLAAFQDAWRAEFSDHFTEEERLLGPLALEHERQRLLDEHASIAALGERAESGEDAAELGRQLEAHIRWEERELFPSIEQHATTAALASLAVLTERLERRRAESPLAPRRSELVARRQQSSQPPPAIDLGYLLSVAGDSGPQWGTELQDLNATLLRWGPGEAVAGHVNDEVDVLAIVLGGSGVAEIDGAAHPLTPGVCLLISKGTRRAIQAGPEGLAYLNVHKRKRLQLQPGGRR